MDKEYKIQVENSAPSQSFPAKSVPWACPLLKEAGAKSIVDLGCGRLRNLNIMSYYFSDITLVDTKLQCERIQCLLPNSKTIRLLTKSEFESDKKHYDAIFLISVLHVIEKPLVRKKLLSLARSKLNHKGFLIVDVPTGERYYRQHCTRQNKHGDGWVMGKGPIRTFYKNYRAVELDTLVSFSTHLKKYKSLSLDKHIIRIWGDSA